jgi:hypothetical protein
MCVHFYKIHRLHLPSLFEKSKKSTILMDFTMGGVEENRLKRCLKGVNGGEDTPGGVGFDLV